MHATTVEPSRIKMLSNDSDPAIRRSGSYVLYWMQASQRVDGNAALSLAVQTANQFTLPTLVCFGLDESYPEANARHYTFMLEGLADVAVRLRNIGVGFTLRLGSPPDVALALSRDAAFMVCDRGYLHHQRAWRKRVAETAGCPVVQVEDNVVVPVELASNHREYAARTIRPKIMRQLPEFVGFPELPPVRVPFGTRNLTARFPRVVELSDPSAIISRLNVDRSVSVVSHFRRGGESAGRECLDRFIGTLLARYNADRNEPFLDATSHLSPYLHFGHLSPARILSEVLQQPESESRDAFVEELVVRRELACNYVYYEPEYATFDALPEWARKTLHWHRNDPRPAIYSEDELSAAVTHDPYWNASMIEMRETGHMHNYMRMYWGKKVIEWSETPEQAFETLLRLNNRYFLDGRDPASFANVAWIFGLHDRPWKERPIFGTVRFMAMSGLDRKFDMAAYVRRVLTQDRPRI